MSPKVSILIWIWVFVSLVHGQNQTSCREQCAVIEMVRADGWRVPGIRNAKSSNPRQKITLAGINDIEVRSIQPSSKVEELLMVYHSQTRPNAVEVFVRHLKIDSIHEYSRGNQVFGYRIRGLRVSADKPRVRIGSAEILYFYDSEGQGKFTIARYAGGIRFEPIVPEWVRLIEPRVRE